MTIMIFESENHISDKLKQLTLPLAWG